MGLLVGGLEGGVLVRVLGAVLLGEEEGNTLLLLRGGLVELVGLRAGLNDVAEPERGDARSLRCLGLVLLRLVLLRCLGLLRGLRLLSWSNQSRLIADGNGGRDGALEHEEVLHRQIADVEERGHLNFRRREDGCCSCKSES